MMAPYIFAITRDDIQLRPSDIPDASIDVPFGAGQDGINEIFIMIQNILLTVVLPLVVIGAGLYIAYLLFSAEGDENRMKQAWKALTFTAVALLLIALAYVMVALISGLDFS